MTHLSNEGKKSEKEKMEKRKIDLNTINIPKSHALFDYYIKDILELFVCQVSLTLYSLIHVTRDPFGRF